MSHVSKVVNLAATLLLFAGGISLAAPPDPTKQISPQPPPQLNPCITKPCPDLVPWKGGMGGGIGVKNFGCSNTVSDPYVPQDHARHQEQRDGPDDRAGQDTGEGQRGGLEQPEQPPHDGGGDVAQRVAGVLHERRRARPRHLHAGGEG